jgi:hypothetical protein
MNGEMERQSTSEASGTPQRLSGLSYDEALAILDKGQASKAPAQPPAPGRTWRGGRVALVALAVVGVTAGVGLLGQASHRVLDCPVAPSPWRPDCAAVRTADASALPTVAPASPSRAPSGAVGDGAAMPGAAAVESAPRRRSVVARGSTKAQDAAAAPAPIAVPSPSVAELEEGGEKPAYTLSTASPPPEQGPKGELRPSLVPDALTPVSPSPRLAPRLARPDEPKRPAVADRAPAADRAPVAQTAVVAEPTRPSPAARPATVARSAADARPAADARSAPGARLVFDAPEQAHLPTVARRRPEPAREEVKVTARAELPAVEASRQPPAPPTRPGAVERTARVPAGPAPTTGASRAPLAPARAEPAPEPRSRLARAGDEPAPRSIRRGGVAPRSDERPDAFPREFAQVLREHNRRSVTPRPDVDRSGGFPREFVEVLREHNMAYSAGSGGRRSLR